MKTYTVMSILLAALLSIVPACSGIECYVCEYLVENTVVSGDARCSPRYFSPLPTQSCSGNCTKTISSIWVQETKTITVRITRGCSTNGTCEEDTLTSDESPINIITSCCNEDSCNTATTRRHLGLAAILILGIIIGTLIF